MPHRFFRRAFGNLLGKLADFAGHFRHQVLQTAHIPHLLDLCFEVIQVETLALAQFFRHFGGGGFVYAFLDIFHQGQNVAHAQNPAGDTVGVEGFQAVDFFAHTDEFNRLSSHLAYRQGRTAARIAVHFGQHHAGQRQRLVKGLRRIDRVLTQHRIDDEQGFHGIDRRMECLDFVHHFLIDGQTSGGIHHQHVVKPALGMV